VTQGLILLVFLAALVAFGWTRLRRRLGMRITWETIATVMAIFILVVLTLWAFSRR
jgi:hypothetical protein